MNQKNFENKYQENWDTLRSILEKKEKKVIDKRVKDLPELYREVCNHLALARERNYSLALVNTLEDLVMRAHQYFYGSRSPIKFSLISYFMSDFPAAVRKEKKLVFTSVLFLFGSFFFMVFLLQLYPHLAYMILPNEQIVGLESMYDPTAERFGEQRGIDSDFLMWAYYINNNVTLDFKCFAWGIFLGLGSIFFLLLNGIVIGTMAGHICNIGYGVTFWPFVIGHGSLELIAAALAGAAGMKMGFSIINTGRLTRIESLKKGATEAAFLLYGTAFMTFLAAFVEAYWSSRIDISNTVKYTVGTIGWVIVILYFIFSGRRKYSAS